MVTRHALSALSSDASSAVRSTMQTLNDETIVNALVTPKPSAPILILTNQTSSGELAPDTSIVLAPGPSERTQEASALSIANVSSQRMLADQSVVPEARIQSEEVVPTTESPIESSSSSVAIAGKRTQCNTSFSVAKTPIRSRHA